MDFVHFCFHLFEGRTDFCFQLIQKCGAEGITQVSVIKVVHLTPEAVIREAAFRDQAMDMWIPFQRASKSMQDANESRNEISGFVYPVKHAEHNGTDSGEQAVQQRAVFQKKRSEFFWDCKNTMTVVAVDQFTSHGSCPFTGIKIAASWAETGMAAKRDKVEMTALRTAVHGAAESGVTTVDHFINVFNLRRTGMKSIDYFFVMIAEYFLKDVHKTIMKESGTKENPKPLKIEG